MTRKFRPFSDYDSVPRGRRLVVIVWLFAGIVVCLLVAAINSVDLLSAGRAFVGAEGQWSRAQKDAVFYLSRYAQTHDENLYDAFQHAIAVPLGTRKARIEMLRPDPDLSVVRAGFIEGRNHPADIDSMITLFQRFRSFAAVQQAMFLWERADAGVDDLISIGRELHDGPATGPAVEQQIERINRINVTLGRLEEAIAATLGEAQRAAQSVLLAGMLSLAAILLVAGIMVSQRFVAQNERLQETLRESEAQTRQLIESAPMPLLIVRAAGQEIIYGNERAMQQFALTAESLSGKSLADFHVDPDIRAALPEALSRHGSVRDYEVHFKDQNGREFWLLLSAQPIRHAGIVGLLVALANIDDRKRAQDDMRKKAMQDPLTTLPNRTTLLEAVERAVHKAKRRQGRFSILFVDLDHFKEVNDSLGHAAGDRLLQAVSERLVAAVRQSDLVARMGGDEFVVLIEEPRGPEEVMIVANKILHLLERPVLIDFHEVAISASVGISSYPEDGDDLETLMKHADAAMYQAKERGRNTFQHYSADLHRAALARADIEKRVRAGLENDEFFLEYQPEIDLASGERVSVEALLRWKDPSTGIVMPADFLPLAEESGTIVAIGEWVVERAITDAAAWREQGVNVAVSINVSGRQLHQSDFPDMVAEMLQIHGVPPEKVRIEIPEPALLVESDAIDRSVRALQKLGVQVAIDNFGTGYSSLGLVRGFAVQAVKIDKSLVSSCVDKPDCAAIMQAVGSMAHNLGLVVVASGVETPEERYLVASLGCDRGQGMLIGKPVSWIEIARATAAREAVST
jgi:diguanylate cyclase (GGDEF)-like protein/PAS domain S-box-containing protein